MKIKCENFILRPLQMKDAPSIAKQANNISVSRHMGSLPYPYLIQNARSFISKRLLEQRKEQPPGFYLAIVVKEEAIGVIGFSMREKHKAELGYWLGEEYWGRGIGTSAIKAVASFAFRKFKLTRLYARTFLSNKASSRALEKAGFLCEGILRKDVKKNGKYMNCRIYAKIR